MVGNFREASHSIARIFSLTRAIYGTDTEFIFFECVEGAKTFHKGRFYSFQNGGGAPPFRSTREGFALCGARLKELFEKSSLRNLKNFSAAVFFFELN